MFYNGIQSDSSITVVVRSDSNGTAVLTLSNGDTGSVVVDTAINYGHGRITIAGLTSDKRYTYTVTVPDGSGGSGEITTFKSSGNEKIAFTSCESNENFEVGNLILKSGAKICINLGDESYGEDNVFNTVAKAQSEAVHNTWRKSMREKSNKMHMAKKIGYGVLPDDHDTFLNDFGDDPTDPPADLNTLLTANSRENFADQAGWATAKASMLDSIWSFTQCNTQDTSSADTDPFYFAFDCGDMRVIVPSLVVWSKTTLRALPDVHTVASTPSPIMNAEQLAWFKNELNTTTKTFKLILSQKCTYTSDGMNNSDDWDNYNDMDTVLQWIHDNSLGFAVPGGVIWGTGDWHSPGVGAFDSSGAPTYDHVVVNACPSGRFGDIRDSGNWTANTKEALRASEIDDNRFLNYGIVESFGTYIEISIKLHDGSTYTKGRVNAGENKIAAFIPQAVAI